MSDLRKKFTENAEQFDSLMVEMLKENKKLFEALEESVEKIAEYENDIDTINEMLHEVGGCDGEKGYAEGWDSAVNEIERQMLAHLANYDRDN